MKKLLTVLFLMTSVTMLYAEARLIFNDKRNYALCRSPRA